MTTPWKLETGSPVDCRIDGTMQGFPLKFAWHSGAWFELFERHADYIKQDIERRLAEGRRIAYHSCAISAKSGGFTKTNVEISVHVTRSIEKHFGDSLWVLNPAQYQMESKAGTGLIQRHARLLSLEAGDTSVVDLEALRQACPTSGGDYLRMWSRVLLEDGVDNLGENFSVYYFSGPKDVANFFTKDGYGVMDVVEDYLARKIVLEEDYDVYFKHKKHGTARQRAFVEYYALKVGAGFSAGSRDEFNIWRILNLLRVKAHGVGAQIPAFSEGRQLNLSCMGDAFSGYAV